MKTYSIDFREKIVKAYEQGDTSIRKVTARLDISQNSQSLSGKGFANYNSSQKSLPSNTG